jgi:hypothetical protein
MKLQIKKEYYKYILISVIFLHIFFLINFKFTAWPEMIGWPYFILNGFLPYKDIGIAHTPILLGFLTGFYNLAGVGILQLKIFTWTLMVLSNIILYVTVSKIWNSKFAIVSVLIFSFWQLVFDGNGLWFDSALVPMAILLFYLSKVRNYFWLGFLWGVMFMTKQTAVWFLLPILLGIYYQKSRRNIVKKFLAGVVLSVGTSLFVLTITGLLPHFLKWAVGFGIFILPKAQGQVQLPDLKGLIRASFPYFLLLPLFYVKNNKLKSESLNLLLWITAGSMGAYPRFELFHFQPALPFLAIGSAILVFRFLKFKYIYHRIFIAIYLLGSLYLFATFFVRNWKEGTRFYEPDVQRVSRYINEHTSPHHTIFVMNWWDNVYAFSDRLPGIRPLVPQLSWYQELPGIQDGEVESLDKNKPELVVLYPYTPAGLSAYIPQKVYDYILENYSLEEQIEGLEVYRKK